MGDNASHDRNGSALSVITNETDAVIAIPVTVVTRAAVGTDELVIPASESVAVDPETAELLMHSRSLKELEKEGDLRIAAARSTESEGLETLRKLLNRPAEPEPFVIENTTDEPVTISYATFSTTTAQDELQIPAGEAIVVDQALLPHASYKSFEENGQIRVVDFSDSLEGPRYTVENKTARRIGIQSASAAPAKEAAFVDEFVIPAFGSRLVRLPTLAMYDFKSWQQRNLISVEEQETGAAEPPSVAWILFTQFIFWGAIAALIFDDKISVGPLGSLWSVYGIVAVLLLVASLINWRKTGERIKQAVVQYLNLAFLLIFGPIGLTLIVLFFVGDFDLGSFETPSDELLIRSIQGLLIILLSALPGMLYFQFERRQVQTLRTRYLREIMLLNPEVHTVDDAEFTYGPMLDEVSGSVGATAKQFVLLTGGRPVLAATLLITLGWIVTLWPVGALGMGTSVQTALLPQPTAVSFAFLGAYLFALNMVFRRFTRGDLSPKAYSNIAVRILSAIIIVWVVGVFFNETAPLAMLDETDWSDSSALLTTANNPVSEPADVPGDWDFGYPVLLILAFGVGIIPETGLALIKDLLRKQRLGQWFPSLSVKHPITELDGVSLYDRVRLLEEGVESVENLAHHNLIELMLRSGVPTSRLVDLVDQAILYLHVADVIDETASNGRDTRQGIQILRQHGIRTATDLIRVTMTANSRVDSASRGQKAAVKTDRDKLFALLDPQPNNGPHRLQLVLDAMEDDEWLEYVKNWRALQRSKEIVESPDQFYRLQRAVGP